MEEGRSWETFDPMSGIKKWSTDKVRWATEEKGPRRFKPHNFSELNVKSLSGDDSYDEEENISWMKKDICFLLILSKIIIKKFFWKLNELFIIMSCCIKRFELFE